MWCFREDEDRVWCFEVGTHSLLMAMNKTQEGSDVKGGKIRKHFIWRRGLGEAVTSNLQISRLFALSFIKAIELLSMTASLGAPPHSGVHLSVVSCAASKNCLSLGICDGRLNEDRSRRHCPNFPQDQAGRRLCTKVAPRFLYCGHLFRSSPRKQYQLVHHIGNSSLHPPTMRPFLGYCVRSRSVITDDLSTDWRSEKSAQGT
jgi:hypothetical protein